jgi:hypothetical protein
MIDWLAFLAVAGASLVAAVIVVGFYSLGLLLLSPSGEASSGIRRFGAVSCFVVCALAVLYGIYLVVPAFHQG